MGWLATILGIDDLTGPWYGFWSGFGSDLGEFAIAGALFRALRKHSCEIHGCWRLGRHQWLDPATGQAHNLCRSHHPLGHLTASDVKESHYGNATHNPDQTG